MPKIYKVSFMLLVATSVALFSFVFDGKAEETKTIPTALDKKVMQLIKENEIGVVEIPKDIKLNKVLLGEKLYNDTLLSADGTISCASCHALDKGGVDRLQTSTGIQGQKGPINSPTVFNSSHNFVQFWDGRAKDLAEQAQGPVANPLEMGENWDNVVKKLSNSDEYKLKFAEIYEGKITKENVADAIAEFEKTLSTPDSDFDKYLKGDKSAISESVARGFITFTEKGCIACHSGTYFGGNSFQMLNADYFAERGTPITDADLGRYNVTKDEADKHVFKVPMLRNVAVTPPYFHDGTIIKLSDAVRKMAKYQLGEELSDGEVSDIVAFLEALTGTYKGKKLK